MAKSRWRLVEASRLARVVPASFLPFTNHNQIELALSSLVKMDIDKMFKVSGD